MGQNINPRTNKPYGHLSTKLLSIIVISYLILIIGFVLIVYNRFERKMVDEYTRMAEGVTVLMENEFDPDKVDYYIEENFDSEEYRELLQYYYSLRDNYPDIYYMYVYRFLLGDEAKAQVIVDLDDEYVYPPIQESVDWIGDYYFLDEPFASERDRLILNLETLVHTVHTQDGEYLLSYVKPVTDAEGNYVCSMCVDFSMDYMYYQDVRFIIILTVIMLLFGVMVLLLNNYVIRRVVTGPLDNMTFCTAHFKYDTEKDRMTNISMMERLNIRTGDEIENLYLTLISTLKESTYYLTRFTQAKQDIEEKDKEIDEISIKAYKDELTGVGNKADYARILEELNKEIGDGSARFAALMVDINSLKYINDTFGHEKGDKYIIGCCGVICGLCKHSPVFRTGGDEFVVILKGRDYDRREEIFSDIEAEYKKGYADESRDEWERYSASIGMAEYSPKYISAEEVIRKADKTMYANKLKFKEEHGSYR